MAVLADTDYAFVNGLSRVGVRDAIEQALRDERERCRKIAQSWEHRSDVNPARAIASAIQQGIEP